MTITLRTALPADRDTVIDLIQRLNAFEADLTGDRERDYASAVAYYEELLQRLARKEGRIVLAQDEDRVVAVMGFSIDDDAAFMVEAVRRHAIVTDLVVHEDWRGRGIGQMLLAEAERLTHEAGLKRLMIAALVANDRAERTYREFGFKPYISLLVKDF